MKTRNYIISDIMFKVNYSDFFKDTDNSPFLYKNSEQLQIPYINVDLYLDDKIDAEKIISDPGGITGRKTQSGYIIYMLNEKGNIIHLIQFDMKKRNISVFSISKQMLPFDGCVGEVIFRTSILTQKGIVIHASAVEYEGKGIIFSAPSGTGKSTHANLWVKNKGAVILNGDRPALREINNVIYVCGTPWSGSSHIFANKKVPLKAIIMLEQAPVNNIKKLTNEQSVRFLTARCYLPYFDDEIMGLALDNLSYIIKKTPVYLLKCRPDPEAVETVMQCLKSEQII